MQYLLYNIGYVTNVAQKYCFYFTYANKRRSFCQETTSFLIIVLLLLTIKHYLLWVRYKIFCLDFFIWVRRWYIPMLASRFIGDCRVHPRLLIKISERSETIQISISLFWVKILVRLLIWFSNLSYEWDSSAYVIIK